MKFKYILVLAAIVGLIITQSYAQDEMIVEWDDGSQNVVQDALYNAIMGDTVAGGARANPNRVYVLRAGGYYWNNATINANFPLRIVGDDPTGATVPPVIQMVLDINDGSAPGKMITCSDDLTLRNLYIIGSDETGTQTYYQPIEVNATGKRFIIDNCVFERSNFSIVAWAGGSNNDISITNCVYRNLIERPPTQQWAGRGLSVWTDADTVIIENNTFFNINFTAIQLENGAANYVRFNHNTMVNIGRALSSTTNVWWKEAYFANNLLINVFWHGEGASDWRTDFQPGRDPRAYTTGMFAVIGMPSRYGTNTGRRILFTDAAAYLDPYFSSRYADTVRVQPYINAVTDSFFTTFSPANGGQMVIQDTAWLSAKPTFDVDPNTTEQLEAMYNHITASRGYQYYGTGVQAETYFYGLDETDPWTIPVWPLPENFHYTENLVGTDNLPLGDLNWFPTQLADFELNKDAYVAQIEAQAGAEIVEEVFWEVEAEEGTLSGTAAVDPFTGDSWYTMVGGSSIEWTFDVAAGGPVDMVIKASLNNTGRSENDNVGLNFLLNGLEVHDLLGWGEFVFWSGSSEDPNVQANKWYNIDDGQFHEVTYTAADIHTGGGGEITAFELATGSNTVQLANAWNNVSIARIDFYAAGTTNLLASLLPSAAVNTGATPGGTGIWVPQNFNSVALGTGGTATFNLDFETAGNYKVRLFYQNPDATQPVTIQLDGADATTVDLPGNTDSTGLDIISELFPVTEGAHTLALSGAGAKLDWLQLIREYFTSVRERPGIVDGFNLEQNYPNPFNPTTNINFSLGQPSNVKLIVYDILGRRVATLINNEMNTGSYTFTFDASHLASGVYFYALDAGDYRFVKKMMLLK